MSVLLSYMGTDIFSTPGVEHGINSHCADVGGWGPPFRVDTLVYFSLGYSALPELKLMWEASSPLFLPDIYLDRGLDGGIIALSPFPDSLMFQFCFETAPGSLPRHTLRCISRLPRPLCAIE